MAELSIIPDLILHMDRLLAVAQAAERALTRLTHPTIDPDAVPGEVIAATINDLEQALTELGDDELEGLPVVGETWTRQGRAEDAESTEWDEES